MPTAVETCTKCSLKTNHPGLTFNDEGECSMCTADNSGDIKILEAQYANFQRFLGETQSADAPYDCMLMLSGGKDSVYILNQLVTETDKRVLAFTFNHAFEPAVSHRNIDLVFEKLDVDHVYFTNRHGHIKTLKLVFQDKVDSSQFGIITPCRICTDYMVLQSCLFAEKMGIPYIIYCADPGEAVPFGERFGLDTLERWFDLVGEETSKGIFGDKLDPFRSGAKQLPEVLLPFRHDEWNPMVILEAVKQAGLYEAEAHPFETACTMSVLLSEWSFRKYDSNYFAIMLANFVRGGMMPREVALSFDERLRKAVDLSLKDQGSPEYKQAVASLLEVLAGAGEPEGVQRYYQSMLDDLPRMAKFFGVPNA